MLVPSTGTMYLPMLVSCSVHHDVTSMLLVFRRPRLCGAIEEGTPKIVGFQLDEVLALSSMRIKLTTEPNDKEFKQPQKLIHALRVCHPTLFPASCASIHWEVFVRVAQILLLLRGLTLCPLPAEGFGFFIYH